MEIITALAPLVGNIGVPAALCFYTLFEVNKSMKKLTEAVDTLTKNLVPRVEKLENKVYKEESL